VIVGDPRILSKTPKIVEIMKYCKENRSYITSDPHSDIQTESSAESLIPTANNEISWPPLNGPKKNHYLEKKSFRLSDDEEDTTLIGDNEDEEAHESVSNSNNLSKIAAAKLTPSKKTQLTNPPKNAIPQDTQSAVATLNGDLKRTPLSEITPTKQKNGAFQE
jgi:hypothetical protein